jgi:hypothetical protein
MSSLALGKSTSAAEVTHISSHGIWIFSQGEELFMSYQDFPWFKEQPLKSILFVQESANGHLYWPEIDVDLTLEIIRNPERFPLQAK